MRLCLHMSVRARVRLLALLLPLLLPLPLLRQPLLGLRFCMPPARVDGSLSCALARN